MTTIRCPACGTKLDMIELRLTPRQREIRDAVEGLARDTGRPARSEDIGAVIGLARTTIAPELKTLESMGVLTRPNGPKSGYDLVRNHITLAPASLHTHIA